MGKTKIEQVVSFISERKTEKGKAVITAAIETSKGNVIVKRATVNRFAWVNTGLMMDELDKGDVVPAEEALKIFGEEVLKGFQTDSKEDESYEITAVAEKLGVDKKDIPAFTQAVNQLVENLGDEIGSKK